MQSQHSCLPSEMTLVLVPTSRFPVSHLFLSFSVSKSKPLIPLPIYLCISSVLHLYVGVSQEETAFSCELAHFSHFISES